MTDVDVAWMRRALDLAEQGRGSVEPNPLVGAVVVSDGHVVGEGWHQRFGGPHAEVHALAAAGTAAQGSTLYVTLEPCCHHGKTPPCTDAILRAGIARVVAAMPDPFPAVAGKGVAQLRQAGVAIDIGIEEALARRLNAPYLTLLTEGRPYVHLKWAMTLDGKIATHTGSSKWISGPAARRIVHELRGRMDAIVAGIGTALADDPQLTARPPGPRTAVRVVLDSQGRLPLDSVLVRTAHAVPTLVAVAETLPASRANDLRGGGCEVLHLGAEEDSGRPAVRALLAEMGRRRWTNILVEGGSAVHGSFLDAGAVDEVHVFIAPRLAGGAAAHTPIGGRGVEQIAQALPLARWAAKPIESDLYIHGYRH